MSPAQRIYWRVAASTGAALLLSVVPLPAAAAPWQVAWPQLILIYWCMALPHHCGVKYAWATGLAMDLFHGGIFGQNALFCVMLAYAVIALHQFMRFLPLAQQMLFIGLLLLLPTTLSVWLESVVHGGGVHWTRWGAVVTSMLVWPWVFAVLRRVRQRVRLS